MVKVPATAAGRTRLLKKTLEDAGYVVAVRSAPADHVSQSSAIFPVQGTDMVAVTAYLNGWFGSAIVTTSPGDFASVAWGKLD